MQGLIATWNGLTLRNRIIAIGATLLVMGLVAALGFSTTRPQLTILYAGLDTAAAGEIVTELESRNIKYQVKGETIYVEADKRDPLRLELASLGLPRQGEAGYELLDNLNSFATTSEMFNAAYWRAKEGELARTITTIPGVTSARVHIGASKQSVFARSGPQPTASVTLSSVGRLDAKQAKAVQYMTALAIEGLTPDEVVVIDTQFGVLAGPGAEGELPTNVGQVEERASTLESRLIRLLEAYVGPGNVRVNVSLEIDRNREAVSERIYDPESRVVRSKATTDSTENSQGTDPNVTVASNLPDGDVTAQSTSNSNREDSSENVTYEISEIFRESEKLPGAITRMNIAVLLNAIAQTTVDGTIVQSARTPEELEALKEIVQSAAGIDTERGDQVVLQSVPFAVTDITDTVVTQPGFWEMYKRNYLFKTVQALIIGLIIMALGLFVIKPILQPDTVDMLPVDTDDNDDTRGLNGQILGADMSMPALEEDPVTSLRQITAENTEEAVSLLTSWLEAPDSNHREGVLIEKEEAA